MIERLRLLGAGPRNSWVTLSLLVAFVLIAVTGTPPRAVPLHLFIIGGLAAASFRWPVGRLAVLGLLLAGVDLRIDYAQTGSDVLVVTRAAIEHALAGGNPYGVGYPESFPPGAPFPYGPLALLWYLPPLPAQAIEFIVSLAVLGALALRGQLMGLAVYATAPVLIATAADGSNDTSLGLLLLIGLAVLPRKPIAGAFVVGLAIAFKPTAAAWAAPLVGWAGLPALVGVVAGAGLLWLPAVLMWSLRSITASISGAATLHETSYYSLAFALERFGLRIPEGVLLATSLGTGALLAAVSLFRVRSADGVIGWGALIFLVTLFGGFWSTFAYFAAVAPIICWRLDAWTGGVDARVRWPTDPIGRLGAWLDERWPAVESGAQRRFR
ncbi:MAG TPA: hypothetical protein VNT28_03385 [Candidatus Limnocylindrales bacterium]|jgi:hypothetical protein|nr:hypothetical protein [Candidatus Limnocylindrales bacterium]